MANKKWSTVLKGDGKVVGSNELQFTYDNILGVDAKRLAAEEDKKNLTSSQTECVVEYDFENNPTLHVKRKNTKDVAFTESRKPLKENTSILVEQSYVLLSLMIATLKKYDSKLVTYNFPDEKGVDKLLKSGAAVFLGTKTPESYLKDLKQVIPYDCTDLDVLNSQLEQKLMMVYKTKKEGVSDLQKETDKVKRVIKEGIGMFNDPMGYSKSKDDEDKQALNEILIAIENGLDEQEAIKMVAARHNYRESYLEKKYNQIKDQYQTLDIKAPKTN